MYLLGIFIICSIALLGTLHVSKSAPWCGDREHRRLPEDSTSDRLLVIAKKLNSLSSSELRIWEDKDEIYSPRLSILLVKYDKTCGIFKDTKALFWNEEEGSEGFIENEELRNDLKTLVPDEYLSAEQQEEIDDMNKGIDDMDDRIRGTNLNPDGEKNTRKYDLADRLLRGSKSYNWRIGLFYTKTLHTRIQEVVSRLKDVDGKTMINWYKHCAGSICPLLVNARSDDWSVIMGFIKCGIQNSKMNKNNCKQMVTVLDDW